MHLTAKEEQHKKLNEIERCYATIASRFGVVKGVHGKLEHSGMYVLNVLQPLVLLCTDSTVLETLKLRKIAATPCQASNTLVGSSELFADPLLQLCV